MQLNIVTGRQSLEHLCCKVTVALVDLVEIVDPMSGASFDTSLLGFPVPRCNGSRPGNSRHQSRGQPARQVAGVHGGHTPLILELLGHVTTSTQLEAMRSITNDETMSALALGDSPWCSRNRCHMSKEATACSASLRSLGIADTSGNHSSSSLRSRF